MVVTTASAQSSSSPSTSVRIDLSKPRYDQSNYFGRIRHFLDVIDPFTLLTTRSQLQQALNTLDRYKKGDNIDSESVWKAKKIKGAMVHPDTNEVIFAPCRMAAFVPANIPLVVGMLTARTASSNMFWQWANQTYNVCVNYANRNASGAAMSMTQVGGAYAAAVVSSCSLSVGLNRLVSRMSQTRTVPSWLKLTGNIAVPYIAVATAGAVNVLMMRYPEGINGVTVMDEQNQARGTSVAAGRLGLTQVALTRLVLPAPILILPALTMNLLENKTTLFQRFPSSKLPVQTTIITACLWAALPAAIALFPQVSSISVSKMEPEFQNLRDAQGKPITKLFFNKGL